MHVSISYQIGSIFKSALRHHPLRKARSFNYDAASNIPSAPHHWNNDCILFGPGSRPRHNPNALEKIESLGPPRRCLAFVVLSYNICTLYIITRIAIAFEKATLSVCKKSVIMNSIGIQYTQRITTILLSINLNLSIRTILININSNGYMQELGQHQKFRFTTISTRM